MQPEPCLPEGCEYKDIQKKSQYGTIYGHGVANGYDVRMDCMSISDRVYFDREPEPLPFVCIRIRHCTDKRFAAHPDSDNRHLMQSINFNNKEIFQAYLDNVFHIRDMQAAVDTSMNVTAEDKIITLSTCYGGMSDKEISGAGSARIRGKLNDDRRRKIPMKKKTYRYGDARNISSNAGYGCISSRKQDYRNGSYR